MLYQTRIALLLPLLFIAMLLGCKKDKSATPAAGNTTDSTIKNNPKASSVSYTKKMGGLRNWHRSHYYEAHGPNFPTPIYESYNLPDTAMAIGIIDDSTIHFLNWTFKYDRTDTAKQMYLFGSAWAYFYYGTGYGRGVAYFYAKDSIVFCNQDRHATTDAWVLDDVYNTY